MEDYPDEEEMDDVNLYDEEVLGKVSEYVRKESVLESTHRCDSREDNGGELPKLHLLV